MRDGRESGWLSNPAESSGKHCQILPSMLIWFLEDGTMATMNISLPDMLKEFVQAQVDAKGYSTASEYFRALVREDKKRAAKANLDELLLDGIQSGESTPMTQQAWEELRENLRRHEDTRGGVK